nr:hypothetical protein [Tanacetum cinerariifolium]
MFCVFFFVTRVDRNIVDKYCYEFVQIWFTHMIHEIHEYSSKFIQFSSATLDNGTMKQRVPSLMIYLVPNLTLDSARSYVMQGELFTQGTVSSIPIGGSISLEGFLPPILLLVIIIAMVVVTVVVVVAVSGFPSILKLSFMVIGVLLCPEFLLGLLVFAIIAAYASKAVATLSATSFLMAA